ncbi:putative transmembrane protein [Gregarina niphandrodes]|uniref:Transmembrane protein n=1 Tax=Gregarina niphandrodes TaxID=110365 RepID=A0A023B0W4_GRENI|nr:putative transmembrane protein [Gregarina niphandrodes]EZG46106.1 putative transmembrane protein [Gregarina niphandrodes]|eukprot:XP_011132362.1 putative transmembrane protein [Gregarina niphandrodes]
MSDYAFLVKRWSVPLGETLSWEFDVAEWGGTAPVVVLDAAVGRSEKLSAKLRESSYDIEAVAKSDCSVQSVAAAGCGVVSGTALVFRQGYYQVGNLLVWAAIKEMSSGDRTSLTNPLDNSAAFTLTSHPVLQVHTEPYASVPVQVNKVSRLGASDISIALDSSARAGLVVLAGLNDNRSGSFLLDNAQVEVGAVGGSGVETLSEMEFTWNYTPGCTDAAVFPSLVHNETGGRTLDTKHFLFTKTLQLINTNGALEGSAIAAVYADDCTPDVMGDYATEYTYGLTVVSSDTCFRADKTWYYVSGGDAPAPGDAHWGAALLSIFLILFFLGLVGVGYYFWSKWQSAAPVVPDEDEEINSGPRPDPADQIPRSSLRIQPRGALRPPKHLLN